MISIVDLINFVDIINYTEAIYTRVERKLAEDYLPISIEDWSKKAISGISNINTVLNTLDMKKFSSLIFVTVSYTHLRAHET